MKKCMTIHRSAIWVASAILVLMSLSVRSGPAFAEKVTFALDWIPFGKHVPFFVAFDKGYFKKAGLDVNIIRGNGSGNTVKIVNARKVEYGLADMGTMIIARSRGGKTKMVSMFHHKNMYVIYALKGSGIRKPKDLEGKTIGVVLNEGAHAVFPVLARASGIDAKKVKFTPVAFSVKVPSLLAGKLDGVTSYISDLPTYVKAAKGLGKEIIAIPYSDHGVDMYSNGILVTDDRIQGRPGEVKRFVRSINRGIAWSVEHPDAATKMFIKYNGTVDPGLARKHWDIAVDHLLTLTSKKTGIGFMTQGKVRQTIDIVSKAFSMPRVPTPNEVYTNRFITKKIVPKRP